MSHLKLAVRHVSLVLVGATFLAIQGGCRTGPLAEFAYYNPWLRAEWETDEAIAPTLHNQLAELRAIRSRAPSLTVDQQLYYVDILSPLLADNENALLRIAVADTLGQLLVGPSFDALKQTLNDSDEDVRLAVIRSLANHPPQYSIPVLAATLAGDTALDVRMELIRQLGGSSDPLAIRAIATALDDTDPAMQLEAVKALQTATNEDLGDDVPAWREYVASRYGSAEAPNGRTIR